MLRVRSATRCSRWSTRSLRSKHSWSRWAAGRSGSRSAARATARASIGSDFPRLLAPARALAISLVGTQRHRLTRRRSGRGAVGPRRVARPGRPTVVAGRQHDDPPGTASDARPSVVGTVIMDSRRPASSAATTVWVFLCGSTPSSTMDTVSFSLRGHTPDGLAGWTRLNRVERHTLLSSHHRPTRPRSPWTLRGERYRQTPHRQGVSVEMSHPATRTEGRRQTALQAAARPRRRPC